MDKKIYIGIVIVIVAIITVFAVNYSDNSNKSVNGMITIKDMAGRTVNVLTTKVVFPLNVTTDTVLFAKIKSDAVVGTDKNRKAVNLVASLAVVWLLFLSVNQLLLW